MKKIILAMIIVLILVVGALAIDEIIGTPEDVPNQDTKPVNNTSKFVESIENIYFASSGDDGKKSYVEYTIRIKIGENQFVEEEGIFVIEGTNYDEEMILENYRTLLLDVLSKKGYAINSSTTYEKIGDYQDRKTNQTKVNQEKEEERKKNESSSSLVFE